MGNLNEIRDLICKALLMLKYKKLSRFIQDIKERIDGKHVTLEIVYNENVETKQIIEQLQINIKRTIGTKTNKKPVNIKNDPNCEDDDMMPQQERNERDENTNNSSDDEEDDYESIYAAGFNIENMVDSYSYSSDDDISDNDNDEEVIYEEEKELELITQDENNENENNNRINVIDEKQISDIMTYVNGENDEENSDEENNQSTYITRSIYHCRIYAIRSYLALIPRQQQQQQNQIQQSSNSEYHHYCHNNLNHLNHNNLNHSQQQQHKYKPIMIGFDNGLFYGNDNNQDDCIAQDEDSIDGDIGEEHYEEKNNQINVNEENNDPNCEDDDTTFQQEHNERDENTNNSGDDEEDAYESICATGSDNNNPNKPNQPSSSDSSTTPQRGNCPFCSTSNMSFRLYLVHCNIEHPEIGYDEKIGDLAVTFWKSHNKMSYMHQSVPMYHHRSQISRTVSTTPSTHSTETNQSYILNLNDEKKQNHPELINTNVQPVPTTPTASTTASAMTVDNSFHSTQSIKCNELCNDDKNKKNSHWSYEPNKAIRVRRNIYVPRELTAGKDSDMYGLYEWMDKTIAMQFNNKQNELHQGSKIFNLKGKYAIIEPMDEYVKDVENASNRRKCYPWKMRSKLYTKQMVYNEFKGTDLPKPVRQSETFEAQLNEEVMLQSFLEHPDNLDKWIKAINWCKIDVFSRKLNNQRRTTLSITKTEFMKDLKNKNNFDEIEFIPILMFRHGRYRVHHLMIVQIDCVKLGISMIYKQHPETARVTGIHIDQEMIYKQHGWIASDHVDECKCLDDFNTSMNNLEIGDPNNAQNKINALTKRINMLENQLKKTNK